MLWALPCMKRSPAHFSAKGVSLFSLALWSSMGSSQVENWVRSSFSWTLGEKSFKLRYSNCIYASSQKMFIWFLLAACFTILSSSSDAFTAGQEIYTPLALLIITFPDVYISKSWAMLIPSNESGRFTIVPPQAKAIFSWRYYCFKNPQ